MLAMKIEISQLAVALDYTDADIARAVSGRLKIAPDQVRSVRVIRRAIDAIDAIPSEPLQRLLELLAAAILDRPMST